MAMSLTDTGKSSKHIEVLSAINIPQVYSLSSFTNDWNWSIVRSNVLLILIDVVLGLL
jgi:hypothetical protein